MSRVNPLRFRQYFEIGVIFGRVNVRLVNRYKPIAIETDMFMMNTQSMENLS